MKQLLLICAVVALVGCGESAEEKAAKAKAAAAEAKAIAEAEAKAAAEAKAIAEAEAKAAAEAKLIKDPIIEKAIRSFEEQLDGGHGEARQPTDELTKADLEEVTLLYLSKTEITDAGLKELAKLQQLHELTLYDTKITDAGVAELKKALPNYKIASNATK